MFISLLLALFALCVRSLAGPIHQAIAIALGAYVVLNVLISAFEIVAYCLRCALLVTLFVIRHLIALPLVRVLRTFHPYYPPPVLKKQKENKNIKITKIQKTIFLLNLAAFTPIPVLSTFAIAFPFVCAFSFMLFVFMLYVRDLCLQAHGALRRLIGKVVTILDCFIALWDLVVIMLFVLDEWCAGLAVESFEYLRWKLNLYAWCFQCEIYWEDYAYESNSQRKHYKRFNRSKLSTELNLAAIILLAIVGHSGYVAFELTNRGRHAYNGNPVSDGVDAYTFNPAAWPSAPAGTTVYQYSLLDGKPLVTGTPDGQNKTISAALPQIPELGNLPMLPAQALHYSAPPALHNTWSTRLVPQNRGEWQPLQVDADGTLPHDDRLDMIIKERPEVDLSRPIIVRQQLLVFINKFRAIAVELNRNRRSRLGIRISSAITDLEEHVADKKTRETVTMILQKYRAVGRQHYDRGNVYGVDVQLMNGINNYAGAAAAGNPPVINNVPNNRVTVNQSHAADERLRTAKIRQVEAMLTEEQGVSYFRFFLCAWLDFFLHTTTSALPANTLYDWDANQAAANVGAPPLGPAPARAQMYALDYDQERTPAPLAAIGAADNQMWNGAAWVANVVPAALSNPAGAAPAPPPVLMPPSNGPAVPATDRYVFGAAAQQNIPPVGWTAWGGENEMFTDAGISNLTQGNHFFVDALDMRDSDLAYVERYATSYPPSSIYHAAGGLAGGNPANARAKHQFFAQRIRIPGADRLYVHFGDKPRYEQPAASRPLWARLDGPQLDPLAIKRFIEMFAAKVGAGNDCVAAFELASILAFGISPSKYHNVAAPQTNGANGNAIEWSPDGLFTGDTIYIPRDMTRIEYLRPWAASERLHGLASEIMSVQPRHLFKVGATINQHVGVARSAAMFVTSIDTATLATVPAAAGAAASARLDHKQRLLDRVSLGNISIFDAITQQSCAHLFGWTPQLNDFMCVDMRDFAPAGDSSIANITPDDEIYMPYHPYPLLLTAKALVDFWVLPTSSTVVKWPKEHEYPLRDIQDMDVNEVRVGRTMTAIAREFWVNDGGATFSLNHYTASYAGWLPGISTANYMIPPAGHPAGITSADITEIGRWDKPHEFAWPVGANAAAYVPDTQFPMFARPGSFSAYNTATRRAQAYGCRITPGAVFGGGHNQTIQQVLAPRMRDVRVWLNTIKQRPKQCVRIELPEQLQVKVESNPAMAYVFTAFKNLVSGEVIGYRILQRTELEGPAAGSEANRGISGPSTLANANNINEPAGASNANVGAAPYILPPSIAVRTRSQAPPVINPALSRAVPITNPPPYPQPDSQLLPMSKGTTMINVTPKRGAGNVDTASRLTIRPGNYTAATAPKVTYPPFITRIMRTVDPSLQSAAANTLNNIVMFGNLTSESAIRADIANSGLNGKVRFVRDPHTKESKLIDVANGAVIDVAGFTRAKELRADVTMSTPKPGPVPQRAVAPIAPRPTPTPAPTDNTIRADVEGLLAELDQAVATRSSAPIRHLRSTGDRTDDGHAIMIDPIRNIIFPANANTGIADDSAFLKDPTYLADMAARINLDHLTAISLSSDNVIKSRSVVGRSPSPHSMSWSRSARVTPNDSIAVQTQARAADQAPPPSATTSMSMEILDTAGGVAPPDVAGDRVRPPPTLDGAALQEALSSGTLKV
jgi:hypothetical protein